MSIAVAQQKQVVFLSERHYPLFVDVVKCILYLNALNILYCIGNCGITGMSEKSKGGSVRQIKLYFLMPPNIDFLARNDEYFAIK